MGGCVLPGGLYPSHHPTGVPSPWGALGTPGAPGRVLWPSPAPPGSRQGSAQASCLTPGAGQDVGSAELLPARSSSALSRVSRAQTGTGSRDTHPPGSAGAAAAGRGGLLYPGTAGKMKCELPAGAAGSWRCRMRPGWPTRRNRRHVCGLWGEAALGNRALRRPGGCILSKSPGPT